MVYMKQIECPICFESCRKEGKCFSGCKTKIWKSCLKKRREMDTNKEGALGGKECRHKEIRHKQKKRTKYCRGHLEGSEESIKRDETNKLNEDWTDPVS